MNIAIGGKGGTGKTVIAAILTKILVETGQYKLLVIDADPATGLAHALGMSTNRTVSQIREDVITNPFTRKELMDQPIKDAMMELLSERDGIRLLVMGRPEGPGCFCTVNDLLRYGIEALAKEFDITLIDCEAGLEQTNRRVIREVDTMMIVTDTSQRSFQTATELHTIVQSQKAVTCRRMGLVINRVESGEELSRFDAQIQSTDLEVFGYVLEDTNVTSYDSVGRPILELPAVSPSVVAVRGILKELM